MPFLLMWLALAIAGILGVFPRLSLKLRYLIIALAALIAGGLWLWARSATDSPVATTLLGYTLTVTPETWLLTGMALLALLIAGALGWTYSLQADNAPGSTMAPGLLVMPVLGLMLFVWAGDPLTAALMLALFMACWVLALWYSGGLTGLPAGAQRHLASALLVPVLLIWFADAVALGGVVTAVWVELAAAAVLLAGAMLLGVWPFQTWRSAALSSRPQSAVLLMSLPIIAGAAILLPIARQHPVGSGLLPALGLILGLVGLLMGLRSGWRSLASDAAGISGLAGGLAGLVLLTAVFASEAALLSATRVAVFAPVFVALLMFQLRSNRDDGQQSFRKPHVWVVVGLFILVTLAVLGFPLMAGFTSLSGVYDAWQSGLRYFLVGILVALMTGWSAVLSRSILSLILKSDEGNQTTAPRNDWLSILILVVPVLGLIQVNLSGLSGHSVVTWLALLIPIVAGPVVAWLLKDRFEIPDAPVLPEEQVAVVTSGAQRVGNIVGDAIAEAIGILEGPNGLLWVLVVLALLFLIT
ncbi:MAG: hypothetical protein R3C44_03395 [Chloroflexota bacterium]